MDKNLRGNLTTQMSRNVKNVLKHGDEIAKVFWKSNCTDGRNTTISLGIKFHLILSFQNKDYNTSYYTYMKTRLKVALKTTHEIAIQQD